jgi:hypothetical protein
MRTVSFSNVNVQKLLNENFVCSFENSKGQQNTGSSLSHSPGDAPGPCIRGVGNQNVQCFFTTAGGDISHVLTGYVGPEDLVQEIEFAISLHKAMQARPSRAGRILVQSHRRFLKTLGFSDTQINSPRTISPLGSIVPDNPGDFLLAFQTGDVSQAFRDSIGRATRSQTLSDHQFAIQYPLLATKKFRPEMLVGSGASFFGSFSTRSPQQEP